MNRALIAAYAAEHHGVIPLGFLETVGVTARQARLRVQVGEWQRVHAEVFVVAGAPLSFAQSATAALAAIPAAVLSHHSAAQLHGFDVHDDRIHLSVPHGARNRLEGGIVHQTTLPPAHRTRRQGLRVTSLERTVLDLSSVLGISELQRCVEDQLVAGRTTVARLESVYLDVARGGRRGLVRARTVLGRLDGQPPTESELEARFVRLIERNALPLPTRQMSFEWADHERGRVDFWYPAQRLIVELDGRRFHLRAAAFERDRRRDQLALVQGMRTVRFTHLQLSTDEHFVVGVVASLLANPVPG